MFLLFPALVSAQDRDGDAIADARDNCPDVENPDQIDLDRDGIGEDCDDAFCYVIGGPGYPEAECLDPELPLQVVTLDAETMTGEEIRLPLYLNRGNLEINFQFEIDDGPENWNAGIDRASGTVRLSTPYEYHYLTDSTPTFHANDPGRYRVRVSVDLAFADDAEDGVTHDEDEADIFVDGDRIGFGACCAIAPGLPTSSNISPGLPLLLLLVWRRARPRS